MSLFALVCLTLFAPTDREVAAVELVRDGQPRATIVLSRRPRAAAQLAALELRHYIRKISGAELKIVREPTEVDGVRILVGESQATRALGLSNANLQSQEYVIRTTDHALILMGRDHDGYAEVDYASYMSIYHALPGDMGTCHATHALLENQLGVRWYYPNEEIGEVVPNDNTQMCRCPRCVARYRPKMGPSGEASHYAWGFVNRVARRVRRSHPKAMVSGLAYFNYTDPPTGMVFEPNVAVTFCKFYQSYHDKAYQQRDYQRISEYVHKNRARFFTTWEYPIHPFMSDMPFPCLVPRVQADDVRRLREIRGFKGGTMDRTSGGTYRNGRRVGLAWSNPVMDFMNVYWRLKLYDDFEFDVDRGLDEYFKRFFGPGANGMRRFFFAMEDRWMRLGGAATRRGWWGKLGTAEFLGELSEYVAAAKTATTEGTIHRRRVELVDRGILQYLRKARAKHLAVATHELAPLGTAAAATSGQRKPLDDATWATAPVNRFPPKAADGEALVTTFQLAHDRRHLHLRARCSDPRLREDAKDDALASVRDSLEIWIDARGAGGRYHQLIITAGGALRDAQFEQTGHGVTRRDEWKSGARVKTRVVDKAWEIRARIPLERLGVLPPSAGSRLRVNLVRDRQADGGRRRRATWSSTLEAADDPERFGVVTLNGPDDRGRLIWSCDFEGVGFASRGSTKDRQLIGGDGWYANINYASRGWDRAWSVVGEAGRRRARADLNRAGISDVVPHHAVRVSEGAFSVEARFRRASVHGNMPLIRVADGEGRTFATIYAWPARADLIAIEQAEEHGARRNIGDETHGLGDVAAPGRWFGLKLEIDPDIRRVIGYVRAESGAWRRLNREPLHYQQPRAEGRQLFVAVGSRKIDYAQDNVLEMDDIRVRMRAEPVSKIRR